MRTGERNATIRLAGFAGALFAAMAVALSAYAAHAVLDPEARTRLVTATAFAFGHGVALAALARHAGASLRIPLKHRYAPNSSATSRASNMGMPAAERRGFSFIEGLAGPRDWGASK